MNEMLKNTLKLTLITLLAGALLGLVYMVTKEPIAYQEARLRREAFQAVYPTATTFTEVPAPDATKIKKTLAAADLSDHVFNELVLAQDTAGQTIGYVVTMTSKSGYGGDIRLSLGVDREGRLQKLYLLSISETAGLGMRAKEDEFLNQYIGQTGPLDVQRHTGQTGAGYIDAISGATITSRAVTRAVNAGLLIPPLLDQNEKGGTTP
ncbi:MAG: RnfABCDGE type electron transport complex subunit G [Lachnospiraceae bacterium]|nr:RnfABCDGE type electron transport complex subunit G [Lachnospiraceae bacterium]MDY5742245.1 RnfABCDGE type electron transport complex subunit G [Lachnospiraceae bacterium]